MKKQSTIDDLVVHHKPEFEKRENIRETGISFMERVEKKMVQSFYDERMPHAEYDWTNRRDYIYKLYAVIEELYLTIWSSDEYNNYFCKTINEFIAADKQVLIDTESVFSKHMCIINKLFNKYIEEKYNVLSVFGITEQQQCRIAGKESYGCFHLALTKRDIINVNPGLCKNRHYDLFAKFNEDCLKNDDIKELDKVNDASTFRKFLENYDAEKFERYRIISKEFNSKVAELKEKIQKEILDLINEGYCLSDFGMRLN